MPAQSRRLDLTLSAADRAKARLGEKAREFEERMAYEFVGDDIFNIPPPEFLLDDYIVDGSLTVLVAEPGAGKSAIALYWSMAVAKDIEWSRRVVRRPGKVLYFSQEGRSTFPLRARAFLNHRALSTMGDNFVLYTEHLDLSVPDIPEWEAERLEEGEEPTESWQKFRDLVDRHDPVLIVIDPLVDYIGVSDENSNNDLSRFTSKLIHDYINERGISILIPAHKSKHGTKGQARGASSVQGSADRVYHIYPEYDTVDKTGEKSDGDPVAMKISCSKAKDGAKPPVWYGKWIDVDLPEMGKRMNYETNQLEDQGSFVIDGISQREFEALVQSSKQAKGSGISRGARETEILQAALRLQEFTHSDMKEATGISPSTITDNLKKLIDQGRLVKDDDGQYRVLKAAPVEEL